MNNVVEIFRNRKMEELVAKKDADIIDIKCADKAYKTLREIKKGNKAAVNCDISLSAYKFSDKITEKVNVRKDKFKADVKALEDLVDEIYARLELAHDYASKMAIMNEYKVIVDNKIAK